jgi:Short C-terminal domain
MMRRRRPLMRAAVIGGGAYAVGRHNANRNAEQAQAEAEQNAQINDLQQQQAAAPPPPQQAYAPPPPEPAPAAGPSLLDQLNQLDALHQSGALTDNEFTAAKAKLLSS